LRIEASENVLNSNDGADESSARKNFAAIGTSMASMLERGRVTTSLALFATLAPFVMVGLLAIAERFDPTTDVGNTVVNASAYTHAWRSISTPGPVA
jgi:hypothetical protein